MFQPVVPFTGYVGWRFLERTLEPQQEAFSKSSDVERMTEHFRANIRNVQSAEALVADRQLLQVALGAFGLSEDINNTYFIQKILSDGTTADDALSNRIADKRYREFSAAFGFGSEAAPKTVQTGFADEIIDRFTRKEFERAVGDQNNDLRLAMSVKDALQSVTAQTNNLNAQWFGVMGNPPLRSVMEKALGLPASIAQVNIDQQLTAFKDRAASVFGTDQVADLQNPDQHEKLIRLFLIRSEAAAVSANNGASTALTLLQSAPRLI